MTENRDSRQPLSATTDAEFVRLARASPGSALHVHLPRRSSPRVRLVLMTPDDESALAYLERPRAAVACLIATLLYPATEGDVKGAM
jgi:hypothetical protein